MWIKLVIDAFVFEGELDHMTADAVTTRMWFVDSPFLESSEVSASTPNIISLEVTILH